MTKNAKMTISVPIATCLPRLYQRCTTVHQSSKTVKIQSKQQQLCDNFWICLVSGCPAYRHAKFNRDPFTHFRENWVGTKRETKKQ